MAKKQTKVDVLDQMHEAALIANEQKKKMDSLKQESDRAIARSCRTRNSVDVTPSVTRQRSWNAT